MRKVWFVLVVTAIFGGSLASTLARQCDQARLPSCAIMSPSRQQTLLLHYRGNLADIWRSLIQSSRHKVRSRFPPESVSDWASVQGRFWSGTMRAIELSSGRRGAIRLKMFIGRCSRGLPNPELLQS
jgi:hypothetical protein